MSLGKIKSTFYNNIRHLLAIFVLLISTPAYSQLCIDSFQTPMKLEQILNINDLETAQLKAYEHINRLAKGLLNSKSLQQRQSLTDKLATVWDRLRHDERAFTYSIMGHFEKRLKASLIDAPIVRQRLYGHQIGSMFSILNFHYQLPFVLISLKIENITLKELPFYEK